MTNTGREAGAQDLRDSDTIFDLESHTEADVWRVLDAIGAERVARWLEEQGWLAKKEED